MARKPSEDPAKTKSTIPRARDGEQLIKTTIYIPIGMATRLRLHCAEHWTNMSSVIEDALAKHLDALDAKRRK
jgi:hypothetical protein